jgi:hypothetical protein
MKTHPTLHGLDYSISQTPLAAGRLFTNNGCEPFYVSHIITDSGLFQLTFFWLCYFGSKAAASCGRLATSVATLLQSAPSLLPLAQGRCNLQEEIYPGSKCAASCGRFATSVATLLQTAPGLLLLSLCIFNP